MTAQGALGLRLPDLSHLDPRCSPHNNQIPSGLCLNGYTRLPQRADPIAVSRRVELDAKTSTVSIEETLYSLPMRLPYLVTLEAYKAERLAHEGRWLWSQAAAQAVYMSDADGRRGPGGLNVDIPVPIKSRAFETIFGGSSVGLNVQGDIRIFGGFRNENRSEVRTTNIRGSNTSFKMNQTQRFTVTGRIGEKVTVNVDQDSERAFDFDNNLRLNYGGYDDEIVQTIEAGNIALSLPGTRFVTFAGKSSGLFGVKSNMQLGNLALTTIASQEKGENKRLTLTGGASEEARRIHDYEYRRFAYFFVDEIYRENFKYYSEKWVHQASPRIIADIEVYKSDANYDTRYPQSIRGWAVLDPAKPDTTSPESYLGNWIRLDPLVDYYVEKTLGYIVPTNPLMREEVLAVAFRDTLGRVVGNINYNPLTGGSILLKLIKPRNPLPSFKTSKLEWKNVYYLGERNIDRSGFQLKIYFKPPSGDLQESQVVGNQSRSYLNIFGLDEIDTNGAPNPDNNLDNNPTIINWARGELIFPYLEPFDPDNPDGVVINGVPVSSLLDPAKRDGIMYDTTSTSLIAQRSKFFLEVKSKNRSATYHLGFNIIENSEEVRLDGKELRRDQDYIIDYFSGTLTILNEEAARPTANVEISYQSNQLFQLERKTIMGTRAEYRLNRESFIGGTFLYLNERTLDQRVRIGQGPIRNFIWDINSALRFSPGFLTKAIDALPMVRTSEPSTVAFQGEIAQIIPNPNTLNSPSTGDNDGVAYVDDFEAAKRVTPLGVLRRGWVESSVPDSTGRLTLPELAAKLATKGKLYWYNPYGQVPIKQIKPKQDVNANVAQTTQVLSMVFTPAAIADPRRSWGGIMRALSPGFFDQTETKYLEIWIYGDTGRVHIDLGAISEDIIPNGRLDGEDRPGLNGYRDNILDDDEDVGLDGMANSDPRAIAAGGDFWDLNSNNVKDPNEPFSDDDWYYESASSDYSRINGTEGSRRDTGDTGTIRPDTEDLNGNGIADQANNYFEYSFDLDKNSPDAARYIRGGLGLSPEEDYGWRMYRIPLDDYERKVGQPDRSQIEYVRIWIDGAALRTFLSIAEINLVGNEWREAGIAERDSVGAVYRIPTDSTQASVVVAVVNTQDNPDYVSPPGVAGERDRVTQVLSKEQSLVLRARNLRPRNVGIVQKSFFAPLNFINYRRLRMFVYGQDDNGELIKADTSAIVYFLRFGADERNYYEFRERVFPGWDKRNEMDIDMLEMTGLKNMVLSQNYDPSAGAVLKRSGNQELRIRGEPSLTNIRLLISGVVNADTAAGRIFDGEIWVDEFRASATKKDKGMAMRARADIKLADVMQIGAEIERRDADFHNVSERTSTNPTDNLSTRLNASVTLDRMLPQSLGLSIPASMNYASSNSLPKYIPGKDVETSVLPASELDKVRSVSDQSGFTISARRRVTSKNWLLRYTFDNLSASMTSSRNHSANSTTLYSDRTALTGSVSYMLTFGRNNYFTPLSFVKGLPLLGRVGGTKLYYTPQNFDMKFQNNISRSRSETRVATGAGVRTNVRTDILTRDFHTNFKLVESLSLEWSRGYTHDLSRATDKVSELFSFSPGEETNVNQSFSSRYNPQIFSWLNNSLSYTSSYRYVNNVEQRDSRVGRQANNNSNLSVSAVLRLSQLIKPAGAAPGRRGQGRRQEPERGRAEEEEQKEGAETPPETGQQEGEIPESPPPAAGRPTVPSRQQRTESKGESGGGNVLLQSVAKVLNKFKDISLNYGHRTNVSNFGLDATGKPSWRYQFGLERDPGVKVVSGLATNPKTFSESDNYGAQTGITISRGIGVDMRFTWDQQRNESTTISGNTSVSALGEGTPFPELTLTISGLEKVPLFRQFANTVSMSSNFTPQFKTVWVNAPSNVTSRDETRSFRPLAKISVNWKNGMMTSIQYNKAQSLKATFDPRTRLPYGGTKTSSKDLSITHTYSKRSGFRIPIWFLKNKELKNSIDLSVTFSSGGNISEAARGQTEIYEEVDKSSRWSLTPKLTYSFSSRVRGGAHFEIGTNKSKRAGETKIKELGVDVNISIRGN